MDRLEQLFFRLKGYFQNEPLVVLVELLIIWAIVWVIYNFLQGTRGARAIKGLVVVFIGATFFVRVVVSEDTFERLNFIYSGFVGFAAISIVILFQPEIRRGLVALAEVLPGGAGNVKRRVVIEEILAAIQYLSKNKIGALIAIERETNLRYIVEGGTRVDAVVSDDLLNTIFWPGSALHDMGVVITGDKIVAAGVQFPLAEGGQLPSELGSRHRAAIGLSQEADCLILIVSEETGTISLAERGNLKRGLTIEALRSELVRGLGRAEVEATAAADPEPQDVTPPEDKS
ncbi:MAG: diadenylate cyclase CdaA [Phycisphaeraceae bacterium]